MNSMIRSFCFVSLSMGAGMFAQQFVAKLWAADSQSGSPVANKSAAWTTAKDFYATGRATLRVASNQPADEAILVAEVTRDSSIYLASTTLPSPTAIPAVGADRRPQAADVGHFDRADSSHVLSQSNDAMNRPPQPTEKTGTGAQTPRSPLLADDPIAKPSVSRPGEVYRLPPPVDRRTGDTRAEEIGPSAEKIVGPATMPELRWPESAGQGAAGPAYHSGARPDPWDEVRRRAAYKADQRQRRIEFRKWLGQSPLRPDTTAVPFMSSPATQPVIVLIP